MRIQTKHYIDGAFVESTGNERLDVINPATEEVIGQIANGTPEDVDRAVQAAKKAFPSFSKTTREERIELLNHIAAAYEKRKKEFIEVVTEELGAPLHLSERAHYQMGLAHFREAAKQLETFPFEERRGNSVIRKEPIGVSGLITRGISRPTRRRRNWLARLRQAAPSF